MSLDLAIVGGQVLDGLGGESRRADVGIRNGRIAMVGKLPAETGARVIDASGMVVAPGFINVMSQAWATIQVDGSALSDLVQGVTTLIFGEALSLGPTNSLSAPLMAEQATVEDVRCDFPRLSEGLDVVAARGICPNIASFVGGSTLRMMAAGMEDRPLIRSERKHLAGVLAEELQDGALGLGTALIYAPGRYASEEELTELCHVVARHGGMYASHLRSETGALLPSLEELLRIGRATDCRVEVYHLKVGGRRNWACMAKALARINEARAAGIDAGADVYPYDAGATALIASFPPWCAADGYMAGLDALATDEGRQRIAAELRQPGGASWENLFDASGGGAGVRLLRDLMDGTPAKNLTLDDLAKLWGLADGAEAACELVARDPGISASFATMSEDNVREALREPWVSVCSDGDAHPPTDPWLQRSAHPRSYGAFAKVLGRFVRDEKLLSLPEAIRRMTSLPAERLGLADRGRLVEGMAADVVALAPDQVTDHATYTEPHRLATGVHHVLVNGEPVISGGVLTGARPGRALKRRRIVETA
jgi:N-acyl-D-amino-acid deacylase